MREGLEKHLKDRRKGQVQISLTDAATSALAMFSLKDVSLLQFDQRRREDHNLQQIYHIDHIPSDTQMRKILDPIDPEQLRPIFKKLFKLIEKKGVLEPYKFLEETYLLSIDGSGFYTSKKLCSDNCCQKKHKNGKISYYQQMLRASLVHPNLKEVILFAPEAIIMQDGSSKKIVNVMLVNDF